MTGVAALPDPRRYGSDAGAGELARLATAACDGTQEARTLLRAEVERCLAAGEDGALHQGLAQAPSALAHRALWHTICMVAEGHEPGAAEGEVVARPFAMPVIVVAGARRALEIPGALPDVSEVHALLEEHGALGTTRNFGLSPELCGLDALERLSPSRVYCWSHAYTGDAPRLPGSPIAVASGREQAHLRFLVGAGITPVYLPSFLETAANIGAWGTPFTRTVARQLGQGGLEVLPLARPPAGLLSAQQSGRQAVIDTAFHLFASHALRTCRMTAGEPVVVVSAHREGRAAEVCVSVSSTVDEGLLEGFRWPLHPADDLEAILASITGLLEAGRVTDVRVAPQIGASNDGPGAPRFLSVRAFDRASWLPH